MLKHSQKLKQTKSFVIEPYQAELVIENVYREIQERFNLITDSGCNDIFEFNSKSTTKCNTNSL